MKYVLIDLALQAQLLSRALRPFSVENTTQSLVALGLTGLVLQINDGMDPWQAQDIPPQIEHYRRNGKAHTQFIHIPSALHLALSTS